MKGVNIEKEMRLFVCGLTRAGASALGGISPSTIFHLDILRFNYVQPIKLNAVYSLSFVHDRAPELPTTLIASRLHPLPCKKVES